MATSAAASASPSRGKQPREQRAEPNAMILWKTAGRCAVCAAALLLASFPLLAQKEHTAPPAAKAGAAAGKSETTGKPVAAPAPTAPAEGPAPQPQGPQAPVGEFQPVLHAQGAKISTCM